MEQATIPPEYDFNYLRVPMYERAYRRLMTTSLQGVKIPKYKKGFWYVYRNVGFYTFCRNVDSVNKERGHGVIVDRRQMEAAWIQSLMKYWIRWGGLELRVRPDIREAEKRRALIKAFNQRWTKRAEEYWLEKAEEHPGLDVSWLADDDDDDHAPQPDNWDPETVAEFERKQAEWENFVEDYPSDDEALERLRENIKDMNLGEKSGEAEEDEKDVDGDIEMK